MRTLPHWANLLPLLGGTLGYYLGLGWLKQARRDAQHPDDSGHLPPTRPRPEPPSDEWCPAHDCWYSARSECPGCREEWEQTWALGEDPEELARRDDWADQAEERAAAEGDGWYHDLVNRAMLGQDPHSGWRA